MTATSTATRSPGRGLDTDLGNLARSRDVLAQLRQEALILADRLRGLRCQLERETAATSLGRSVPATPAPLNGAANMARRQLEALLLQQHTKLATGLARRFAHRGEPFEDLQQVALLGLVNAARRFDPARQVPFRAYATACVLGELKRYFRDHSWGIHVPRATQELYLKVKAARDQLTNELGCEATISQIAALLQITDEAVVEAMEAGRNFWPSSLDDQVDTAEAPAPQLPSADGEDDFEDVLNRLRLSELLPTLDAREKQILKMRYFEGSTQRHIAEQIGGSQMHVSRLLDQILRKLRQGFTDSP